MASNAYGSFTYNLVDVNRLEESHEILSGTGQGKRGLGHVTRSGVVMLCAAWELYLEHVLLEGLSYGIDAAGNTNDLPVPVQKDLSRFVRNHKNELKPMQLAGDGWRTVLRDHATNLVDKLNTPKAGPVDELFHRVLGLQSVSTCWTIGAEAIDEFVSDRGDIAHRGRHSQYVRIWDLATHKDNIKKAAVDTDNCVAEFVRDSYPVTRKPWNATTL